ncbi:MAG: hypothetical protein IPP48_01270 [Chitinophagaceae bacterium]|nr:hypothetical protein [Chitinophagaceae bacterium]
MKKKILHTIVIAVLIAVSTIGCSERHYYQKNNKHSDRYMHRHHKEAHLNINLHN